ncbi:uncharacterized protein LOC119836374 [Zerene cesonia]|uniref:uncharacterized protein LOC119836374 n=1 Tax=Zerene cesonia TaxID=33412 RepID=UPI0018E53A93|nr:uncharacterized protein LOC119836374 [Zerene cesonia]
MINSEVGCDQTRDIIATWNKQLRTLLFFGVVALAYGKPQADCPKDGHHYLVPDQTDCSKYYPCQYGRKLEVPLHCPPNTLFSFEQQACELAELVKCKVGPIAIEAFSCCNSRSGKCVCGPAPEEEDVVVEESEEEKDEGEVVWLPNGCPDPRNRTVDKLLPHPNCNMFYQCDNGELVERFCPDNTHFNYEIQRCEWEYLSNCTPGETPPGNPAPGPSPGDNGNNNCNGGLCPEGEIELLPNGCPKNYSYEMLLPHPNCEKFYQCKEDCHVPFWKHETDCDKFWRCVGDKAVVGVCSEGLFFNEEKQSCDFSCNVDCERKVVQSTPQVDGLKIFVPWSEVNSLVELSYAPNKDNIFTKHIENAKQALNKN